MKKRGRESRRARKRKNEDVYVDQEIHGERELERQSEREGKRLGNVN